MAALARRIAALQPDLVLGAKSVCRHAQTHLRREGIALAVSFKAAAMQDIARATEAQILSGLGAAGPFTIPVRRGLVAAVLSCHTLIVCGWGRGPTDKLMKQPRLGTCDRFRIVRSETQADETSKRSFKSLMYFEGCNPDVWAMP
jgi:hypothetical protein